MRILALMLVFAIFPSSFALTPFEMGSCDYSYNMSGGFVMEEVTSFEIKIYSLPDDCNPGLFVNQSGENNHIVLSEEDPASPYIWSFSCDFSVDKQIIELQELDPFPTDYNSPYLGFGNYSDFSPELFEQASTIVEGSPTVLEAGMRIAQWVNENVEYDNDYDLLYEDQKGKASQVFETRKGVCDEFTTLFVSMARSIGIPARHVSGIAYSDNYAGYGMHAWAEFFAGEWVPVDLTFGEFGVVDASHVALSRSFDSNPPPILTSRTGYEGNYFEPFNPFQSQNNSVRVGSDFAIFLDFECREEDVLFPISVVMDREKISDNDYFLITAEFENPLESHVALPIRFRRVDSLELAHSSYEDYVILSPSGKTSKKYLVHVKDLHDGYTYSLPLLISADFSQQWEKTITVDPRLEAKPLSYYINSISQGAEMVPGIRISDLYFEPNPSYGNRTSLVFTSKNTGNKIINLSLEINYNGHGQEHDLGELMINQERTHNLTVPLRETGEFNANLMFYSENVSLARQALLVRAPVPGMELLYQGNTTFYDEQIRFNITKQECYSGDVYLKTSVAGMAYDQSVHEFSPLPDMFFPGKNQMNISFLCVDQYGKSFFNSTMQEITIEVSGIDYIVWLLRSVFRRIMNFFQPKLL